MCVCCRMAVAPVGSVRKKYKAATSSVLVYIIAGGMYVYVVPWLWLHLSIYARNTTDVYICMYFYKLKSMGHQSINQSVVQVLNLCIYGF